MSITLYIKERILIMKNKKADEMEMAINLKAARLAYVFVTISLVIWMIVDFATTGEFPLPQLIIVALQNLIFFGSKFLMTRRMIGTKEE